MTDFEKLGLFYLGRRHDPAAGRTLDEPVLYDSRDLVTHAVCVGMTGSGKTGLCVGLIEEAAIDGVPVLAIDPKGDLGNLLLTFPGLSAAEFRPWVSEEEARRAGLDPDAFAAAQAQAWADGLAAWGQDGARIARLRGSARFGVFTPGSRAGRPVSILSSFAAPAAAAREDAELLTERAGGTATSALVLAGVDAPPRSREHTLVTALLMDAWQRGRDLDLGSLIRQLQAPPFDRVGVVDLESFFPARDRFDLAMRLNGVLAAPGFETWLDGEPLDPDTLLYAADGRPRVSIFSLAHLPDAERMFFVSLLLHQVVGWVRRQAGTGSLRAVLYMDEIAGYFPPVANPPSKAPLLTLLKQGRAHGLGVVLATQNPVDLDYKGLGNTGTWFLGRLQTERDKARVLDGLESAAGGLDRSDADRLLSGLRKRIFLLHNVHARAPIVFETRWTLSYLRGPLSRDQIRALEAGAPAEAGPAAAAPAPAAHADAAPVAVPLTAPAVALGARPVLPPGIQEFFLGGAGPSGAAGRLRYHAALLGVARVAFSDRKLHVDVGEDVFYRAAISDEAVEVEWADAEKLAIGSRDLLREPGDAGAEYAPLPSAAAQPRKYAAWEKAFARWLSQHERLSLWRHPALGIVSRPGEAERDFRIRVQLDARAARGAAVDAVRAKYAPKQAALADRLARAELAVDRERHQASGQKVQTAVSVGATLLGALFGGRVASAGTLGRATTAARGMSRTMKEAADVKRAAESADAVRRAIASLEATVAAELAAVTARFEQEPPLERVSLAPKRGHVDVRFVALVWTPHDPPGR